MKKRILALLGFTSIALAASVISLNSSKTAPTKVEEVFAADDPNTNWGGMKATPFGDRYESNWTSEPKYSTQSPLQFTTMGIGDVWKNYQGDEAGTAPIKVAVIDSGIDIYHEDFLKPEAKNVSITASNVKDYSILDPKSCYIHDNSGGYYSSSVVTEVGIDKAYDTNTYDSQYEQYYSHGTASAACIGAAINGVGGLGIAPKCELLIIRMDFYFTSLDKAIRYAADNGADVINMSLGAYAETFTDGYGDTQTGSASTATALTSAINYALGKDCVVVAAAGNEKTDHKSYPACNAGVIGVGALASKSKTSAATFSNFNLSSDTSSTNNNVDVMAPGYVYTANMDINNGPKTGTNLKDTSYQNTQGTSFASPLTAGAIALARSKFPSLTHTQIEQKLIDTCDDIGTTGWDRNFGYGRVNISNLIGVSYDVEGVTLDKESIDLYDNNVGTTLTADVLPDTATNKLIHWTSSDTSVVTVPSTSNAGAEITVTPRGVGTAIITAKSDFDQSILKQCSVTVSSYVSSEFNFGVSKTTLMEGESVQTSIEFVNTNPTVTDILYESSNEDVATISDSGLITAVSAGNTTITAMSQDDVHEIDITVTLDPSKGSATVLFSDWPSGGTSGDGSALSVTKSIFSISLTKGYNAGSDIRNYGGGQTTVSITNGTISSFTMNITESSRTGGTLTVTSGGGTISSKNNSGHYTIEYKCGATPSSSVTFSNSSQMRFTDTTIVYKTSGDPIPTDEYTVTFNGNGGSTPSAQTVAAGTSITLPSSTRSSYTFLGWSTSSTATSASYAAGSAYTVVGNVTLYAVWQSGSSSTTQIDDNYGDYYSTILDSYTETTLKTKLNQLNSSKRTRTMGYDALKTYGKYTEIDWTGKSNVSGKMFGFYDNALVANSWDNQATWNREHVWPNSLGGNKVEGDMHMVRPASVKINSARGNSFYGASQYDPGQYEVNYRGVAARIILYCAIADTSLSLSDGTSASSGSNTMGKLSDLLRWNLQYLPDTSSDAPLTLRIEQNRNREIYKNTNLQGNRNPFIDHPEYACKIWGNTNATTKQICGLNKTLSSIAVSNQKTTYSTGESFVKPTVNATYTDGTTSPVTGATFTGFDSSEAGTYTINVSYTENGVTATTSYQITVSGDPIVDVTSVTLNQTTASVEVGNTLTLTATVAPSNATHSSVTWSSNNTSVASVTNGVVTAYKTGTATITASAGSKSATCVVTVTPDSNTLEITINDVKSAYQTSNIGIMVGDTNFDANNVANYGNGIQFKKSSGYIANTTYLDIESIELVARSGASSGFSGTIYWGSEEKPSGNSSSASKGDILANPGDYGFFKLAVGSSVGYLEKIIIHLREKGPEVTAVSVDPTSMSLDLNGTYSKTITAAVTAEEGADETVTWKSDNESIATVSAKTGASITVTGHKVGVATITAIAGDKTATCKVTVEDSTPVVQNVEIDEETAPVNLDVYSKKTGTITLKINADAGAVYEVHWTSSNEDVATVAPITNRAMAKAASAVEASATITAVGVGTTTITATAGDKSASYDLTISDSTPHATGVSLDIISRTLVINETVQLTETVIPSDAIEQGVTWSSSNNSIATVTSSGLVTARAVGEATITVTTVDGGYTATCSITVKSSSQAAIDDAKAWAIYFISQTTTKSTCKASNDEARLSGLKTVWPDLQSRYENLSNDAKTAFCTSSDAKIKEALNHYQFIISKFNKNSNELNDFVVDGNGNKPASSSRSLLSTMFSKENSGLTVVILSVVGLVAIGSFFVFRKRKTY